ncbi:START-like domain-containing protein [Hallella bergensis]|uniref:START-like domain-containing protein n=1 Tax=Hallella bergensis TaxID=242750 RepID=UPI0023F31286|nr:START-like domain-containing protein [Hallella bergensis]
MRKVKISIERPLRSRSESIIWKLISTPSGLSRWIAEQVTQEGNSLVFTWGKPGQVYETRRARILDVEKNAAIRFLWEDEDDPEAYTEIAMVKLDVTDEIALCITDFSDPDDIESMTYMWNHDLDRLQNKMGI